MATYPTGTTGTIHIEDTGSWIHIYIEAGQSTTNIGTGGFSWSDPIGSGSSTYSYPAGSGKKLIVSLGPFGAGQGGTVNFTLNATGTQGLGGPTSVSFNFSRDTVPPPPNVIGVDEETHTTLRARFSSAGDGGSSIIRWELGYGTSSSSPSTIITASGTQTVSGLDLSTTYYFWARGVNAVGTGSWSSRFQGDTLAGAKVRVAGVWKDAIPYVRVAGVWKPAVPYVRVSGTWKGTND
jgi:hypothetical protein